MWEAARPAGCTTFRSEALPDDTAGTGPEDACSSSSPMLHRGMERSPRPFLAALAERAVPAGMDGSNTRPGNCGPDRFSHLSAALWRQHRDNIPAGAPGVAFGPRQTCRIAAAVRTPWGSGRRRQVNAIDAAVGGTPMITSPYMPCSCRTCGGPGGRFGSASARPRIRTTWWTRRGHLSRPLQRSSPSAERDASGEPLCFCRLRVRFDRTAEAADLEQAVEVSRAAVRAMPEDHAPTAEYLNFPDSQSADPFQRTQDLEDLREAVEMGARGRPVH